jgi:glycosyltransferase involved in cell wall biosynthesis
MHILYLHQYFTTPHISGGTKSYNFAGKWVKNGHKVTVVTSSAFLKDIYPVDSKNRINTIDIEGINVVCISVAYSQKMSYLRRVMAFLLFMIYASVYLLKKSDFSLVFATSTPLSIAIPALVAKYVNNIPFIFEVRDLWPEYPVDLGVIKSRLLIRLLEGFCKFVYKKACHIVTISDSMSKRLINKYGIKEDKVSTIPTGVSSDLLNHLDHYKVMEHIIHYGLENKFVIGYAGTIGYVNNLDSMINMAVYLRDYKDIVFVIAGNGKEKERLKEKVARNNLTNVKFGGNFSHFEVINVIETFSIAYIALITHDSRGRRSVHAQDCLPNKFFDYIMMGKPIMVNSDGEISRLIEERGIGVCIEDTNEECVKKTILKLKNDCQLRTTLGSNSRKLAEEFDRCILADRLQDIFMKSITRYTVLSK